MVVCAADPVSAQPKRGASPTFGIGASVNAVPVVPSATATDSIDIPVGLTAPITFHDVRFEPQIGFVRTHRTGKNTSQTTSAITFGTGAFYLLHFGDTVLQAGGRIGFTRVGMEREDADSNERDFTVDMFVGPVLGGEYYVSDHFSIGIEARFLYISIGRRKKAPAARSASVLQTNGAAFARFHF